MSLDNRFAGQNEQIKNARIGESHSPNRFAWFISAPLSFYTDEDVRIHKSLSVGEHTNKISCISGSCLINGNPTPHQSCRRHHLLPEGRKQQEASSLCFSPQKNDSREPVRCGRNEPWTDLDERFEVSSRDCYLCPSEVKTVMWPCCHFFLSASDEGPCVLLPHPAFSTWHQICAVCSVCTSGATTCPPVNLQLSTGVCKRNDGQFREFLCGCD